MEAFENFVRRDNTVILEITISLLLQKEFEKVFCIETSWFLRVYLLDSWNFERRYHVNESVVNLSQTIVSIRQI